MRCYTKQHPFYCGSDLHARTMSVCMLHHDGEIVVQRNLPTSPEALRKTIAPDRAQSVMAVACLFPWYWLAALGARAGLPFVLGHALSMKALHGGKANTDKLDAQNIAVRLRGGRRPQVYGSPAERRATRERLRRRMPLRRKRAELLTHIQPTNRQYNLPAMGKQSAYPAHRVGVAERCADPAVQQSIEGARALLAPYDRLRRARALTILKTAPQHEAHPRYLRRTVPGIGELLSLGLLYERHAIQRCPRGQDVVSYCRLVKGAKASAGQRDGTSGTKSGNAALTWAFSAAAVLFLRAHPMGQKDVARLEKQPGKGQTWTVLAPKWARAVSYLLKRHTTFDRHKRLQG